MLILDAKQVKYCNVTRQVGGQAETIPGVAYQGNLFVQFASYGKDQKKQAIQRSRLEFLEQKGQVLCLVIEEETGFTLWSQDDEVKLAENTPSKSDVAYTIYLNKLVAEMRNVGGIQIKDRQYKLRVYPRCFVGSEAVAWLTHHLNISPEEAVKIGQRLIDEKWIHHVVDEHPFQDKYLFYRFYWDE